MSTKRKINLPEIFIVLVNIAMWTVMYYRQCVIDNTLDYHAHNLFAKLIVEGKLTLTYPLYHYATGWLALLFRTDTLHSSVIVLVILQIFSMYALAWLLEELTGKWDSRACLILSAFILNIVQPVFTYSIKPGYSSGNGLVSPTSLACKPFAILAILVFLRAYSQNDWNIKRQLSMLFLLIMTCLAKPMFAMAFVPAMGLLLFVDKISEIIKGREKFSEAVLKYIIRIWPLFVTGCLLIVQYYLTTVIETPRELTEDIRLSADADTHIRFGFMYAWKMVVSNVYVSIVFAYLFPIVLFIIWFLLRNKKQNSFEVKTMSAFNPFVKMCACYGVVSFCYIAFLYQDNGAEKDMNFRNCWIITFTMVYCLATAFLWKWCKNDKLNQKIREAGLISFIKNNIGFCIVVCTVLIHVLFGLALIAKNIVV